MSLINKMLQDLEQRRVDVTVGAAMHDHVRAVAPEPRRIHAAWWLVLLLAASLLAMSAWLWLRPAPQAVDPAKLTLKLASGLRAVTLPAEQNSATEMSLAIPEPTPAAELKTDTDTPAPSDQHSDSHGDQRSDQGSDQHGHPPSSKPVPPVVVNAAPASAPAVPLATPLRTTTPAPVAPVVLNKQVKDLTPQQRAENQYRRASSLLQQGKNADAMAELEQALQIDPLHAAARQTLVGLLLEVKRQDDAIRRLQEGLKLDADQPGLAMILARLQVEKGELRAALDTLQRSLPFAANRADYQAFLAALLQRDKQHKEAADHYVLALRNAPQNSTQTGLWWMGLGISLQAENRVVEAKDAYGRAKASNALSAELQAYVDQKLSQLQR